MGILAEPGVRLPFDPWSATPERAAEAEARGLAGAVEQQRVASSALQQRDAGSPKLLYCLARVLRAGIQPIPRWLFDDAVRRIDLVERGEVSSFDEALGNPWPNRSHARLAQMREQRSKCIAVHDAVAAELQQRPWRKFTAGDLFAAVGVQLGCPAPAAKSRYYSAVRRHGCPNLQEGRPVPSSAT